MQNNGTFNKETPCSIYQLNVNKHCNKNFDQYSCPSSDTENHPKWNVFTLQDADLDFVQLYCDDVDVNGDEDATEDPQ